MLNCCSALQPPVLVELDVGIHPADAVVPAAEFTIGEDGADRRLLENVSADTSDREGSAITALRIARRHRFARGAIVGGKNSHSPRA
jgi:hypothetical protein